MQLNRASIFTFFAFFLSVSQATLFAEERIPFKAIDVENHFAVEELTESVQKKNSGELPEKTIPQEKPTLPHQDKKSPQRDKKAQDVALKSFTIPVRDFCEELYWDGQLDPFQIAIESLRKSPKLDCADCKAFYKSLGSACRVSASKLEKDREKELALKTGKAEKEPLPSPISTSAESPLPDTSLSPLTSGTPTPSLLPRRVARREPSPVAIDVAVRAFFPLTEIPDLDELTLLSLEFLANDLTAGPRNGLEREYFDTLFTYIFSCFDSVYETRRKKEKKAFQDSLPSDPFLRREMTLERLGVENEEQSVVDEELYDF